MAQDRDIDTAQN